MPMRFKRSFKKNKGRGRRRGSRNTGPARQPGTHSRVGRRL